MSAGLVQTSFAGPDPSGPEETPVEAKPVQLTEQSTLSDYLGFAALNNSGLEAAFMRWKAALERVPQARSLPDPRFSYRYFIREIETRVGPQKQAVEIGQMFPWFGKLDLAGAVAAQAAQSQFQKYESAKRKLFLEVKDVYYEYYYLGRTIEITREHVELIKHVEQVARTRYKVATAGHPDVIRAQVELGKLEDRLSSLRDLEEPIVARFNAALNRPVDAHLPMPKDVVVEALDVSESQLFERLAQGHPDLLALASMSKQYQKAKDLATRDLYPDITLGLSYMDMGDAPFGATPSDSGKDAVAAMFSINIPIQRKRISAKVREAKLRQLAAVKEEKNQSNLLSAQLKSALYRLRDAERKIDLYGDTLLAKADESLQVTEAAFRSAKGNFLDLIDAQRVYLEFQLAYERAQADHGQGLAQIEWLVGDVSQ
jgi:outer membrane protein TolC